MKYVHTNIITQDWKTLSEFYINTFQCKIVPPKRNQSGAWLEKGTGVPNAKLKGVHLLLPGYNDNGPTLEIYEYSEVEHQRIVNPNTRGFGHLAFEVDDLETIVDTLLEHGGSLNGELTSHLIEGVGTIRFVYARDPDGNLIELQQWD